MRNGNTKATTASIIAALLAAAVFSTGRSEDKKPPPNTPVLERFSVEQRQKLLAGEVIFEYVAEENPDASEKGVEGRWHGRAITIVNAPVEQCFRIFCEHEKERLYFPRMTVSRILKAEGNRAIVYKELDFTIATVRYTHVMTMVPEEFRVDFKVDPAGVNDIKNSEGYFDFDRIDENRSLFTYALIDSDIGLPVPEFLKKYISSRDLPAIAESVKKRIESGGKWEKEAG